MFFSRFGFSGYAMNGSQYNILISTVCVSLCIRPTWRVSSLRWRVQLTTGSWNTGSQRWRRERQTWEHSKPNQTLQYTSTGLLLQWSWLILLLLGIIQLLYHLEPTFKTKSKVQNVCWWRQSHKILNFTWWIKWNTCSVLHSNHSWRQRKWLLQPGRGTKLLLPKTE